MPVPQPPSDFFAPVQAGFNRRIGVQPMEPAYSNKERATEGGTASDFLGWLQGFGAGPVNVPGLRGTGEGAGGSAMVRGRPVDAAGNGSGTHGCIDWSRGFPLPGGDIGDCLFDWLVVAVAVVVILAGLAMLITGAGSPVAAVRGVAS